VIISILVVVVARSLISIHRPRDLRPSQGITKHVNTQHHHLPQGERVRQGRDPSQTILTKSATGMQTSRDDAIHHLLIIGSKVTFHQDLFPTATSAIHLDHPDLDILNLPATPPHLVHPLCSLAPDDVVLRPTSDLVRAP
jgi:hypothetical protein